MEIPIPGLSNLVFETTVLDSRHPRQVYLSDGRDLLPGHAVLQGMTKDVLLGSVIISFVQAVHDFDIPPFVGA